MIGIRGGAPRRARLVGFGAYLPETVITNQDLERRVDTSDEWIVTRTGIRERRWVSPDQATSDLAIGAARDVLARTGVAATDIDVLILPTCTPDHVFPSVSALTAHGIGATRAAAFDVQAACSGFIYGVAQGTAMIEAGLADTVLVVGAEVLSRFVDMDDRTTCVLFGDGAAGALLTAGDPDRYTGFLGFELGADGSKAADLQIPVGGSRLPASGDFAADQAFIKMNGREVFKFATRIMEESVIRLLERLDISIDEVDLLVAHQANQRIIDHAVKRLGIAEERVFNNLERYGNTSAASIPLALSEAVDSGRLAAGDLVLLVGFGAGLTWASCLVRYEPE
ncbi:MAG: beta-ketoacyl-ACP synthase III [Thermoleophilia bacterium]